MRSPEERLGDLVEAEARGARMKFVLFWNERPSSWGPGPGCLSQFWPAPFTVDGVTYGTAEHWMMAQKATLFDDGATLMEILKARTPQAAKSLGRAVRGFSEDRWGAARYQIVVEGNLAKFSHHDGLTPIPRLDRGPRSRRGQPCRPGLGHRPGQGRQAGHDAVPLAWPHLLGFALMEVRDQLERATA